MDAQGDLFPYARPETILAYCRHLEALTLAIAPEMTDAECHEMLAELSISMRRLREIGERIRASRAWQIRQQVPARVPAGASGDRLEDARKWASPRKPIRYERTPRKG